MTSPPAIAVERLAPAARGFEVVAVHDDLEVMRRRLAPART